MCICLYVLLAFQYIHYNYFLLSHSNKFDIIIDNTLLERYVGDGVLICTSFGSTEQNLSYGGSVVYNDLNL